MLGALGVTAVVGTVLYARKHLAVRKGVVMSKEDKEAADAFAAMGQWADAGKAAEAARAADAGKS